MSMGLYISLTRPNEEGRSYLDHVHDRSKHKFLTQTVHIKMN